MGRTARKVGVMGRQASMGRTARKVGVMGRQTSMYRTARKVGVIGGGRLQWVVLRESKV